MDALDIVSYSEVSKFQTCKRMYYYGFLLGLRPLDESSPVSTGIKGHKILEYFYRYLAEGMTKEKALKTTAFKAREMMATESFADFPLLTAWTLVENYIRTTEFKAKSLLIENRFLLPASKLTDDPDMVDIQIGFTPDLVLERTGGFIDVEDYKFIQRAWPKSKIDRYQQSKLYQLFLKRMGYNVSRSLIRFFNVQTGLISAKPYVLGVAEEEILIRDFIAGVRETLEFKKKPEETYKTAPRTMNYNACNFCSFSTPCTMEAEGKNASKEIAAQYKKRDYDYTN